MTTIEISRLTDILRDISQSLERIADVVEVYTGMEVLKDTESKKQREKLRRVLAELDLQLQRETADDENEKVQNIQQISRT